MSEAEARALLEDCLRVLWYRDTRALNKITIAKVSSGVGVRVQQLRRRRAGLRAHPPALTLVALPTPRRAQVTAAGSSVSEPFSLDTKWDYKSFVKPKAGADTGGSW